MSKTIDVRVNIRYSSGSGAPTTYDEEINITSDGANGTMPLLVDAPLAYNFASGYRVWANKRSRVTFGSVKVYDQDWMLDDNQLTDKPPLIRIYVSVNGAAEVKVYDGKSYSSKYIGNNVYEIKLSSVHEALNVPVAGTTVQGINPVDEMTPPTVIGRQVYQFRPLLYDYATNKYLVCNKESNGTFYGFLAVRDGGDLLAPSVDYTSATITIDGTDYLQLTLTSPAIKTLTVDMTFNTALNIYNAALKSLIDYKGIVFNSIIDNATAYYSGEYGHNVAQNGTVDIGDKRVIDIFNEFGDSVMCSWHSPDGVDIYFDPLKVPENETASLTINKNSLLSDISSEIDTAPNLTLRMGARKNHYILGDGELATGLLQASRALVTRPARVITGMSVASVSHPTQPVKNFEEVDATHSGKQFKDLFVSTFTTSNSNKIDAQIAHLMALYGDKTRRFFTCEVSMSLLEVRLGDIATIDHGVWSGSNSRNAQVVGISGDLRSNKIKLTLWG